MFTLVNFLVAEARSARSWLTLVRIEKGPVSDKRKEEDTCLEHKWPLREAEKCSGQP